MEMCYLTLCNSDNRRLVVTVEVSVPEESEAVLQVTIRRLKKKVKIKTRDEGY